MPRTNGKSRTGLYAVGAIVLIALEVLAAWALVELSGWLRLTGFLLHVVVAAAFFKLLRWHSHTRRDGNASFSVIALLMTLAVPAYGIIIMALFPFLLQRVHVRSDDYFSWLEPQPEAQHIDMLLEEIRAADREQILREVADIASFQDIFLDNDLRAQENAITKLSLLANREAVLILQAVLRTSRSDTRILAATALQEIEEKTLHRIEELNSQIAEEPQTSSHLLELARTCDLYCHLAVQNDASLLLYQDMARENYEHYLTLEPDDKNAFFEYGRLLLRIGEAAAAEHIFRKLARENPDYVNAKIWLAEACFKQNKIKEVRALCAHLATTPELPPLCEDAVLWWTIDDFVAEHLRERV
ncbi:MAG TPA: tetratricopeptide repeat protein [Bacteroidetes bacterium]|nr:tetratricopeptide repeat protein [Bacteroidota bacterium]